MKNTTWFCRLYFYIEYRTLYKVIIIVYILYLNNLSMLCIFIPVFFYQNRWILIFGLSIFQPFDYMYYACVHITLVCSMFSLIQLKNVN